MSRLEMIESDALTQALFSLRPCAFAFNHFIQMRMGEI